MRVTIVLKEIEEEFDLTNLNLKVLTFQLVAAFLIRVLDTLVIPELMHGLILIKKL